MNKIIFLIIIIGFLLLTAVTNPTKGEYILWSMEKLLQNNNISVTEALDSTMNSIEEDVIVSNTTSQNFVFFSKYETRISGEENLKVLGIYSNFISISNNESANSEMNKDISSIKESSGTTSQNENITILDYSNNKPIKNAASYKFDEENKTLKIKLKDGDTRINFGQDHPNGIKIDFFKDEKGVQIPLEEIEDGILNEYGELVDIENYSIQIGTHDFNSDNIEELIVAIGDGYSSGQLWIYSYHKVDDILKINPFHMEMTTFYQSNILIDNEKIQLPYGSQGLYEEYVWYEDSFLKR